MPVTPYHFGPSGFLGLLFRKWIDLPVFVLANVAVDIEVLVIILLNLGLPRHRYAHTLVFGAVVGALWGLAAYPCRVAFVRCMRFIRLPYQTSLRKMILSGILGVWLHVIIDSLYHADVRLSWPARGTGLRDMAHWHLRERWVKYACLFCFLAAGVVYALIQYRRNRQRSADVAPIADS